MYRKMLWNTGEGLKDEDEGQSEGYRNQLGGALINSICMSLIFLSI
jgi:hypothetical protein